MKLTIDHIQAIVLSTRILIGLGDYRAAALLSEVGEEVAKQIKKSTKR